MLVDTSTRKLIYLGCTPIYPHNTRLHAPSSKSFINFWLKGVGTFSIEVVWNRKEEESLLGLGFLRGGDFQVTWVVRLAGDGGADNWRLSYSRARAQIGDHRPKPYSILLLLVLDWREVRFDASPLAPSSDQPPIVLGKQIWFGNSQLQSHRLCIVLITRCVGSFNTTILLFSETVHCAVTTLFSFSQKLVHCVTLQIVG
jgi:hypothetical protein